LSDNQTVVAAAVRRPAAIMGTGRHRVREFIEKYNRRREAILRCLKTLEYDWEAVPEKDACLVVRKTANLHTGGTIHDVTEVLSDTLKQAAVNVSRTHMDSPRQTEALILNYILSDPTFYPG